MQVIEYFYRGDVNAEEERRGIAAVLAAVGDRKLVDMKNMEKPCVVECRYEGKVRILRVFDPTQVPNVWVNRIDCAYEEG